MLALWRIEGKHLPRDVAQARGHLAAAEIGGHRGAARILGALLATGAGGSRDWPGALALLDRWADRDPLAETQRAVLATMALDADGNPRAVPVAEPLSEHPQIHRLPGLLTAPECAWLIEQARPRLQPARIFHEGQARFVADPLRRSDAAGFPLIAESPVVHALNRRIAAASGTAVAQGEPLQVLRYRPGQEYRPHLDAMRGLANQRALTMLIWLSDDYDGGETCFEASGLAVRGRIGDGLLFRNIRPDGTPDPASRHAGRPVTRGEKMISSRWIRQHPQDDFGAHEAER